MSGEIARRTIVQIAIAIGTRGLGFLKEILVVAAFGLTGDLDAFTVALGTPTLISGVLSGALLSTFTPVYLQVEQKRGRPDADRFFWTVSLLAFAGCLPIGLGLAFGSHHVIALVAPGFHADRAALAGSLLQGLAWIVPLNLALSMLTAYANIHRSFVFPALAAIPSTLLVIASVVMWSHSYGIHVYSLAFVVSLVLQLALQLAGAFALVKPHVGMAWRGGDIWNLLMLTSPLLLGTALSHINEFVDQMFASSLSDGANAALALAFRIIGIPLQIVLMSLTSVSFPYMARAAAEGDDRMVAQHYYEGIGLAALLVLPIVGSIIAFPTELVGVAFGRGAFGSRNIDLAVPPLVFYCLGLTPMAVGILTSRVFNSYRRSVTLAKVAFGGVVLNIILDYMLIKVLQSAGIALATSCVYLINSLLLHAILRRDYPGTFLWSNYFRAVGPIIICGLVALGVDIFAVTWCRKVAISPEWTVASGLFIYSVVYLGALLLAGERFTTKAFVLVRRQFAHGIAR